MKVHFLKLVDVKTQQKKISHTCAEFLLLLKTERGRENPAGYNKQSITGPCGEQSLRKNQPERQDLSHVDAGGPAPAAAASKKISRDRSGFPVSFISADPRHSAAPPAGRGSRLHTCRAEKRTDGAIFLPAGCASRIFPVRSPQPPGSW